MIELIFKDKSINEKIGKDIWCLLDKKRANYQEEFLRLNRPQLKYYESNSSCQLFFIDQIHFWFIENNIKYSLEFISRDFTKILFEKESDAVLFKLTWC